MAGGHRIRTDMRVQGMTAWTMLVSSHKVILPVSVGVVMAMAFNNAVAPAWVTSTALYGLPVAFLLMLLLVVDGVADRRRTRGRGER
jgi:hypothetical protein